jgi:hypothetical protein
MARQIGFTSTEACHVSGTNTGWVYSPNTLEYPGPAFDIKAGESLMIVPNQPAGNGPWKIYRSVLVNSELKTFIKTPKAFCLTIVNKWLTKNVRINNLCRLETLLCNPGIAHFYSSLSFDDLTDMNNEKVDDDDDDDDDDDKKTDLCPCCSKVH